MIETWEKWIATFDRAFETDRWDEARSFLTDDVVYIVAGAPFGCELRGREQVIAGFRKSLDNFDRRFDTRHWEAVDLRAWADQAVTCLAKGSYVRTGKPLLTFAAKGSWFFREGKISLMTDVYDISEVHAQRALEWLAVHGKDLDASYT
jgi:hypothetical protein